MAAIHLVGSDDRSLQPLQRALAVRNLDVRVWTAANSTIDYRKAPPDGIFVALVGTQAARADCAFVRHFIDWAESHGCETANGAEAVELSTNRLALDRALARHALPMPPTLVVRGRHGAARAVGEFGYPLTIVPALVGDGPVSRILEGAHDFGEWFENSGATLPDDQLLLLRRASGHRQTVRVTLIDGVPVHTTVQAPGETVAAVDRFRHSILRRYARFAAAHGIAAAAFELALDRNGNVETLGFDLALDFEASNCDDMRDALVRHLEGRLVWRDRHHIAGMFPAIM
jgi:hypothetical protein